MSDSEKQQWRKPAIRQFRSADEMWAYAFPKAKNHHQLEGLIRLRQLADKSDLPDLKKSSRKF